MTPASAPAIEGRSRRVLRNTFFLFGSEKTAQVFSWIAFAVLTRYWDVGTYGQYALIKNWVAILATFSDLGLNALTIREVAHRKEKAGYYLRNVMAIRSFFSLLFLGGLICAGGALHYEKIVLVGLFIMGSRVFFDCVSGGYVYLIQAHEWMGLHGSIVIASSVARLIGIVGVVWAGGGVWAACAVWGGVSAGTMVLLWGVGRAKGWRAELSRLEMGEVRGVLRQALPLATFWSLQMLYFMVDSVILKSLKGNESVGFYDAAYTPLRAVLQLSQLFGLATLPVYSTLQDKGADLARVAGRSLKLLFFFGVPITLGGALLATPLMVLVAGPKYASSGPVFATLVLSLVPFFLSNVTITVLTVKKPFLLNLVYFSMLALNVVLNFALIPGYGTVGAAWATVICETLGMFWGLVILRDFFRPELKTPELKPFGACLAASAAMGLPIYFDPRIYWLALGPLVYASVLYLLGGIAPEDLVSLRSALRPKK